MTRKTLPIWMVFFAFTQYGLTLYAVSRTDGGQPGWSFAAKLLGFPLLYIADAPRLASFLFANSVLWALVFAAFGIARLRLR